jgi:hypothetical protein
LQSARCVELVDVVSDFFIRVLSDGTYPTLLINPKIRGAARRERLLAAARTGADLDPDDAHLARIIEYDVPDRESDGTGELIVLLSTITDPGAARADELAAAYNQRWGATRCRTFRLSCMNRRSAVPIM